MAGRFGIIRRILSRSSLNFFQLGFVGGYRMWTLQRCKLEAKPTSGCLVSKSIIDTTRHYLVEQHRVEGPMAAYQRLSNLGRLKSGDLPQERVAGALDKLFQDLLLRVEPRVLQDRLFGSFWKKEKLLQGMYIYGGVGRGKTMLMDLFYNKVNRTKKRRVHFQAFMLDVHSRLHILLQERDNDVAVDSIKVVAEQLVNESHLLCLDEVEVLWPLGMVVVATSNSAPEQLYRGGLNHVLFEPFIKQLKEQCRVYSLDEGQCVDYRRSLSMLEQLYLYPLGNDGPLDEGFMILTGGVQGSIIQIPVMMGRNLQILAANGVARASFRLLCGGPYGAADYLAIAQNFQALFLDRIPWLGDPELENEARRFITLIDGLYEANTVFICSSAVSVDELFKERPDINKEREEVVKEIRETTCSHVVGKGGSSGRSTLMIGEMEWSATGRAGASLAKLSGSPSFTRAASARAVSRLVEMQSQAYLSRAGTLGGIILSKLTNAS